MNKIIPLLEISIIYHENNFKYSSISSNKIIDIFIMWWRSQGNEYIKRYFEMIRDKDISRTNLK
jgi:hypothetical protein